MRSPTWKKPMLSPIGCLFCALNILAAVPGAAGQSEVPPRPIPIEDRQRIELSRESLIHAVTTEDLDEARRQLTAGHDANSISQDGASCLQIASMSNQPEMVRLLLVYGADVDDFTGSVSPLMYAVARGYHDCARILLEHGADTGLESSSGKLALDFAHRRNDPALISLVARFGLGDQASVPDHNPIREREGTQTQPPANDQAARTIRVTNGKELASKLRSASNGDIFQLGAGTYSGQFVVSNVHVTIRGDLHRGSTLTGGTPDTTAIVVVNKNAHLQLERIALSAVGKQQVALHASNSQIDLTDCTLEAQAFYNCYVSDVRLRLTRCTFRQPASIGIVANDASRVDVFENRFLGGNQTAIHLASASQAEVIDSHFLGLTESAIAGFGAGQLAVRNCKFIDCALAIYAGEQSRSVEVESSEFRNCNSPVRCLEIADSTTIVNSQFSSSSDTQTAIDLSNSGATRLTNNLIRGSKLGIAVAGIFEKPVAINRNHLFGTRDTGIYLSATRGGTSPGGCVAYLSHNEVVSVGASVVVDSSHPVTLSKNLLVSTDNGAVSLQRNSLAVLNGNDIHAQGRAISFFETNVADSYLINEQLSDLQDSGGSRPFTTPATDALLSLVDPASAPELLRSKLATAVVELAKNGELKGSGYRKNVDLLRKDFQVQRVIARKMLPVRLEIEDMAGTRRASAFWLHRSGSGAAGSPHYIASDIKSGADLYKLLCGSNSPFPRSSRLAGAASTELPAEDKLLAILTEELNRLVDDPLLLVSLKEHLKGSPKAAAVTLGGARSGTGHVAIQKRNRRLVDALLPEQVFAFDPIIQADSQLAYVLPGDYWIVARRNRDIMAAVSIATASDAAVVVKHPQALWLPIQTMRARRPAWELFVLRSKPDRKAFVAGIRRPQDAIMATPNAFFSLRSGASQSTIAHSLAMARQHMPDFLAADSASQEAGQPKTSAAFSHGRLYVQRIMSVAGNASDAGAIAEFLRRQELRLDVRYQWMSVLANIEARTGDLGHGIVHGFAASSGKEAEQELAVLAAVLLHSNGFQGHAAELRAGLSAPSMALARLAALALLDDPSEETRLAMLSFHNRLYLKQAEDPEFWNPELFLPSTLYLLAYGNPSDLGFVAASPLSSAGLFYLSGLVMNPLVPARHLIEANQNEYDPRRLGEVLSNRPGGLATFHQLQSMFVRHIQFRYTDPMKQQWWGLIAAREAALVASVFLPSADVVKMLGSFGDETVNLNARADATRTLASTLGWYSDPEQLNTYVANWQAEHLTYHRQLHSFTAAEIEVAIQENGGKYPPAFDLFLAAHALAGCAGIDDLKGYSTGVDRRHYVFYQCLDDDFDVGGLNGAVTLTVVPNADSVRFDLALDQVPYFNRGTLIDGELDSQYPMYKYVQKDGRALIESVQLRQGGRVVALQEINSGQEAVYSFVADAFAPAKTEGYLDVHLRFFNEERVLTFALHAGENARRIRRGPGKRLRQ